MILAIVALLGPGSVYHACIAAIVNCNRPTAYSSQYLIVSLYFLTASRAAAAQQVCAAQSFSKFSNVLTPVLSNQIFFDFCTIYPFHTPFTTGIKCTSLDSTIVCNTNEASIKSSSSNLQAAQFLEPALNKIIIIKFTSSTVSGTSQEVPQHVH